MSEPLTLTFRAASIDAARELAVAWASDEPAVAELRIAAIVIDNRDWNLPDGTERRYVIWSVVEWVGSERAACPVDGQTELGL